MYTEKVNVSNLVKELDFYSTNENKRIISLYSCCVSRGIKNRSSNLFAFHYFTFVLSSQFCVLQVPWSNGVPRHWVTAKYRICSSAIQSVITYHIRNFQKWGLYSTTSLYLHKAKSPNEWKISANGDWEWTISLIVPKWTNKKWINTNHNRAPTN